MVTIRFFNKERKNKVLDRQRILSEAARQGDGEYRGQRHMLDASRFFVPSLHTKYITIPVYQMKIVCVLKNSNDDNVQLNYKKEL